MAGKHAPTETAEIAETLKRAAAALRGADVPFALAGSVAAWARGGPAPCNDLDFAIPEAFADRAESALADSGMRTERPPEGWLLKAWDGDVLVDLIWDLEGLEAPETLLERAQELSVQAVRMPVLAIDDVIVSMLCALDEHALDLSGPLATARALREQIDWRAVRERTARSPYARGFLALLEALDIVEPAAAPRADQPRVRVVPGG
jgi:putative nucleotidyltransferase-like protein